MKQKMGLEISCSGVIFAVLGLAAALSLGAQPPQISPFEALPGDAQVGSSVEKQDWARIAAGGPGFLMVWEDQRTVLSGFVNSSSPISGNETDIYGARLDAAGNLLDASPILISNEGRNQTRPQVAWNGQSWLVVWVTQRPDWYFFEDIVGVRISPGGEILDPQPIPLRLENNDPANDGGRVPSVTSNGSEWLVVWEDQVYSGNLAFPALAGVRVGADGTVLDTPRAELWQHDSAAFGPREPQAVWAQDLYLLIWSEAASEVVLGRRFDSSLVPLDPAPFVIGSGPKPRVATDGTDFLVVTHRNFAYRVTHEGQVLDPTGIGIHAGHGFREGATEVAWDGLEWALSYSSRPTPDIQDDADLYLARIGTDGTVTFPPAPVFDGGEDELKPTLALGPGGLQLAFVSRDADLLSREDASAVPVASALAGGGAVEVGIGLPRQAFARVESRPGEHLVVFVSQGSGVRRLLAQRINDRGEALDVEPVVVAVLPEGQGAFPDVGFDGTRYLVAWVQSGALVGRRLATDLTPVDSAPVVLLADAAQGLAVSGLDGHFLLVYPHRFSGDQQTLRGIRVSGSDLQVADGPFLVGSNYALDPHIRVVAGKWLAVWVRQFSHDTARSEIRGAFVSAGGIPEAPLLVDQAGYGDFPSVAVGEDRVLITWSDNVTFNSANIEGRLLDFSGSFLGDEFVIADQGKDLFFTAAGWAGDRFIVAWSDYRSVAGIEQMRADIYATTVTVEGSPDPLDGFSLSAGPLPEDLPVVVGSSGKALVLFSRLQGEGGPEVQRLGRRLLTFSPVLQGIFADDFESGDMSAWSAAVGI